LNAVSQETKTALTKEQIKKVEELTIKGKKAFDKGNYEDALMLLSEAYNLYPTAGISFNIGRVYEVIGNFNLALEYFNTCLNQNPEKKIETKAREKISEINELMSKGKIIILSNVNDAQLWIDGVFIGKVSDKAISVSAGRHWIEVKSPEYVTWQQEVTVHGAGILKIQALLTAVQVTPKIIKTEQEQTNVLPVFETEETSWYQKWWVWTIIGGVAVSGGVMTYLLMNESHGQGNTFSAKGEW
jgi:tetratricopeptide (TPR) repeat protein